GPAARPCLGALSSTRTAPRIRGVRLHPVRRAWADRPPACHLEGLRPRLPPVEARPAHRLLRRRAEAVHRQRRSRVVAVRLLRALWLGLAVVHFGFFLVQAFAKSDFVLAVIDLILAAVFVFAAEAVPR